MDYPTAQSAVYFFQVRLPGSTLAGIRLSLAWTKVCHAKTRDERVAFYYFLLGICGNFEARTQASYSISGVSIERIRAHRFKMIVLAGHLLCDLIGGNFIRKLGERGETHQSSSDRVSALLPRSHFYFQSTKLPPRMHYLRTSRR